MKIGIVDAELIYGVRHRFPNLCCMKLSGYYKSKGNDVNLITNLSEVFSPLSDLIGNSYDKIFVSKVFTKTDFPKEFLEQPNVEYGGTGFFFDKASPLPDEIEHHKPDYTLYNNYIKENAKKYKRKNTFNFYTDYSMGYLTRGCPRACKFCVNRTNTKCREWSPIEEFMDENRPKLCFIDDNFLSLKDRENKLKQIISTGKPFIFHQGLDFRLLDDTMMSLLSNAKYDGKLKFAFDNIKDFPMMERQMNKWKSYTKSNNDAVFYVLVGFPHNSEEINDVFWKNDIIDMWRRIDFLIENRCFPYIMRHENATSDLLDVNLKEFYNAVSCWANQTFICYGSSFEEYLVLDTKYHGNKRHDICMEVISKIPEIKEFTKKCFKKMKKFS